MSGAMTQDIDQIRADFEQWVSAPPYEKSIDKYPDDPVLAAWPKVYRDIEVQLAFDAALKFAAPARYAESEDRESQLEVHLTSAMKMIDWIDRQNIHGVCLIDGCYHIHGKPAFNQARAIEALDMKSVHETDAEYAGGGEAVAALVREIGEDTWFDHAPVKPYGAKFEAIQKSPEMDYCLVYTHPAPAVPDEWKFEKVGDDAIKIIWGGSGVVVNKDGTMAKAVAAIALYELAKAILASKENK